MRAKKNIKLGILISGSGRTLENIYHHIEKGELDASISIVISSRRDVYGITRAQKFNLPVEIVEWKNFKPDIISYSKRITEILDSYNVDLVIMAGFLSKYIVPSKYNNKVMNIHPSLIPAFCGKGFYGMKVHQAVIERGVKYSGCTVHFVDNEYDHGPIILQKIVEVLPEDTPERLASRVFEKEKEAYIEAIKLFIEGRLEVRGNKVIIRRKNE